MKRAYTLSRGIKSDPMISLLLDRKITKGLPKAADDSRKETVIVGWGQKDNTRAAQDYSDKHGIPYVYLEDGFIGYLSHPSLDKRRVSLIADETGIYYDARRPSDLENYIKDDSWLDDQTLVQAESLMAQVVRYQVSKYNHASEPVSDETAALIDQARVQGRPVLLLVDQVSGDKGVALGLASEKSFAQMLADAKKVENALILVKTHPDVLLGRKKGYLDIKSSDKDVTFVHDMCPPMALIALVDRVYTVTSQMGFDALMAGKAVHVYGMPFYAGWGLTVDALTCERRTEKRSLQHVFAAAFMKYCRYACPHTATRCGLDHIIGLLSAEKQMPRLTASTIYAVGFTLWKRGFLRQFLPNPRSKIIWLKKRHLARKVFKKGDSLLFWGRGYDDLLGELEDGIDVWRVEDGFIRSVGLGVDLRRPASLAIEKRGIYYDSRSPSALEDFLNGHDFTISEQARAQALIDQLRLTRISKYNVGMKIIKNPLDDIDTGGRSIALVTGQVEGDASLAYGSPTIRRNADLIEAVKANVPDSFIIYKPHPDVLSGNRKGHVSEDVMDRCVDAVMGDIDIQDCLDMADSVHVMTSGAGFEALVQGKQVYCYGLPFYAGWGLTHDAIDCPRRQQKRCLEDLVYAAYIVYPTYVSWPTGQGTSVEKILQDLSAQILSMKTHSAEASVAVNGFTSRARGVWRKVKYLTEALIQ